jgi:LCP family protein required for cell wall assembly
VLDPRTGAYVLRTDPARDATADAHARETAPTTDPTAPTASTAGNASGAPGAPAPTAGTTTTGTGVTGGRAAARAAARGRSRGGSRGGSRRAARGTATGAPSRRKPRARAARRNRALLWTAAGLALVTVAAGGGGYALYEHFNNNITTVDTAGAASDKAVDDDHAVNILLIGTDSRQGLGKKYGDAGSVGHADTTILFHVSKDRSNATALSIPRDTITDIPDCPTKQPDGTVKTIPGTQNVRFNTSLGQLGRDPGCTMRTVQALTGIRPDHFLMADFTAVKDLSTAVGGVDVCVGKDIDDPGSHLKLSAGHHVVKGEQALAFVRTRDSVGFGGDLSRIQLQQQFLASLIRKMKSSGTLTSPTRAYRLADTATKALTVDKGIGTIKKLTDLGRDLSRVPNKNITFLTMPVIDNPADGAVHKTVLVDKTKAPQIFTMIKNDVSLSEVKKSTKAAKATKTTGTAKSTGTDPLKGPMADAQWVRVEIYNGSGVFGASQDLLAWLQNTKGDPRTTNGGDAPAKIKRTTLEYAPNQADQARRLAQWLGLSATALKEGTKNAAPLANMTLTLGEDFTAPGTPISAPTVAPTGIQRVQADKTVCEK